MKVTGRIIGYRLQTDVGEADRCLAFRTPGVASDRASVNRFT